MANATRAKRANPSDKRSSKPRSTPGVKARAPTPDQIARRAYQLWQERGQVHGQDMQDWLEAERQLLGK